MFFIVYNQMGKILRTGSASADDVPHQAMNPGEQVMAGSANDQLDKIDVATKEIVPMTYIPAELAGTSIINLPPGSKVTVNDVNVFLLPIGESVMAFTFKTPGLYECLCENPVYFSRVLHIVV